MSDETGGSRGNGKMNSATSSSVTSASFCSNRGWSTTKPFQFTIGRMLGAVAWLCLSAWLGVHLQTGHGVNRTELVSGTIACASAGLYCAARKAPIGALLWIFIAVRIASHLQPEFSVVRPFELAEYIFMSVGAAFGLLASNTSIGVVYGLIAGGFAATIYNTLS
jgi:hypothetical protein